MNGKPVPQKGYITDELTDYALEWLRGRDRSRPFFLYLSHKGVHNDYVAATRSSDFIPAERHRGRFEGNTFTPPKSANYPPEPRRRRPRWVRDQSSSWHGVDFPYHSTLDVGHFFKRYAETLLAVDESVGRMTDTSSRRSCSIRPSSSTWGTTASRSASTASSTNARRTRSRCGCR